MEQNLTREQMLAQKYPKKEKNKYLVLTMIYRFVALGLINGAFSLLLATMVGDLGFDTAQRAALVTANSTGQLIASFIIGFIIDRVNSKLIFSLSMVVAALACMARFITADYAMWIVIMAIWGFCYNAVIVGNIKILGLWFTKKEAHRVNGWFVLAEPLGQFIGLQITLSVAEWLGGWKTYYLVLGAIALVAALLILIFCKNRPNEDSEVPPNYTKEQTGLWKDFKALVRMPRMWLLWIAETGQACMISIVATYALLVLQNDPGWGLEVGTARRVTQMVMLGAVIGYFVVPLVTRIFRSKFKNQEMAVAVFTIICGIFMAGLYMASYLSYSFGFALVGCLIAGIFQGGYIAGPKTIMVLMPECAGPRAGAAVSCSSIIGRIALVGMSALAGVVAANTGDNAIVMVLLYAPIIVGTIALIIFVVMEKKYLAAHPEFVEANK